MNDSKIKRLFVEIDGKYYGGSVEIIENNLELKDFSISDSSGFFSLTDLILYELNRNYDKLGTKETLIFKEEEYVNYLRNYIDSKAFRFFGFISLDSIKNYLIRLFRKRRLNIDVSYTNNFISKSIFEKIIISSLKSDHPLILQLGIRKNKDFPKYSLITAYENGELTISMRGKKETLSIDSIYDYNDRDIGLLNMEFMI